MAAAAFPLRKTISWALYFIPFAFFSFLLFFPTSGTVLHWKLFEKFVKFYFLGCDFVLLERKIYRDKHRDTDLPSVATTRAERI